MIALEKGHPTYTLPQRDVANRHGPLQLVTLSQIIQQPSTQLSSVSRKTSFKPSPYLAGEQPLL